MNILTKKFYESLLEPKIFIGGKWNISIVSRENGRENFIFGKNKKSNLILNQGLDILSESKYFTSYNGINYSTIPAFLYSTAVLGDGLISPNVTDTQLTNQLQESTSIKTDSCSVEDNYINGTRTFKKVYDFPSPTSKISVSEIGLNTPFNSKKLFSKFLLERPVSIEVDEFIRLYYDFSVGSDAIINPINISSSSGGVNASGQIKLCGNFNDIFLSMDSNGNPTLGNGDSPRTSLLPYYEKYCSENPSCTTECFGTCFMVDQNPSMPTVNNSLSNEWIGERLEESSGNISASTYVNGNFYRDITYTFNNDNPTETKNFGGFLFTVTKTNRQNTWDGWFWKFTNNQVKYNSKSLVIILRQSINRI
jgi:hypothetical protein